MSHPGEMSVRDEDLAALRTIAWTLRSRIEALDPLALGYAYLWQNEELQPWSSAAENAWSRADRDEVWTVHHLAVLHHAQAYDLENESGVEAARPHWKKALEHWAWLYRSDFFWAAMTRHLTEAMDRPPPEEVIATARERLPADLLAVHIRLAIEHRLNDPATARTHMALVTGSAFPPDAIAAARRSLVPDLDNRTAQEVKRVKFGAPFDDIIAWLRIDPTNPHFLRSLLYLSNNWAKFLVSKERWHTPLGELLDQVEAILVPALPQLGEELDGLRGELARYESWRGFWLLHSVPKAAPDATRSILRSDLQSAGSAAAHCRKALELDRTLALDGYHDVSKDLAEALTLMAELSLRLGQDGPETEAYLREALQCKPEHSDAANLLARVFPSRVERSAGQQSLTRTGSGDTAGIDADSVQQAILRGDPATAVGYFEFLSRNALNLQACAAIECLYPPIRAAVLDILTLSRRLEDARNELQRKKKRFRDSPWTEG
ncbi:MAG: hypothetical protein ACRDTG_25915 [Pseudonocardiaceae bacterium]